MDTQSEQAAHTGGGIGNDRCNIFHLKKNLFSLVSTQAAGLEKKGRRKNKSKIKTLRRGCSLWSLEGLFASCSTEVGYMVFSTSFGRCCFSLKRWPILSRMEDQRRFSHSDPMKLASQKPRESALIAQLPRCAAKCICEAKQWKNSFFVAAEPSVFMILQFRRNRAFDVEDCNYCLFLR